MTEIASLIAIIGADISGLQSGLSKTGGLLDGAAGQMRRFGSVIASVFGGAQVLDWTAKYDAQMKNIQAVTGRSSAEMADLSRQLVALGTTSTAGPQQIADTMYDIVGGVADASTHMAILTAAIHTAEAGQADLGATTKGLISVMNSYSFGADKASFASDVLTQTVAKGVGTMDEFVSAIGPMAGMAASTGVGFDDLGASMAFMTTKGFSASMAATDVRYAMVALIKPNTDMEKALQRLGVASGSAAIKQYGLAGTLKMLKDQAGGSADSMAKMLGSVEALGAATALTGDDFQQFSDGFKNGMTGITEASRAVQLESISAQWQILMNNAQAVGLTIGQAVLPVLTGLAKILADVIQWLNQTNPALLPLAAGFALVAAAAGPVLSILGAIVAPLVLIGGAVAGLKVAWDSNFLGIRDTLMSAWAAIQPGLEGIKNAVTEFFNMLNGGGQKADAKTQRLAMKLDIQMPEAQSMDFGSRFAAAVAAAAPQVLAAVEKLLQDAFAWLQTNGPILFQNAVSAALELGAAITNFAAENGPKLIAAVGDFLQQGFDWLKANGPQLLHDAIAGVFALAGGLVDLVSTAGPKLVEFLGQLLEQGFNWLRTNGPGLLGAALAVLFDFGQQAAQFIATAGPKLVEMISQMLQGVWTWIATNGPGLVTGAFSWLSGALKAIWDAVFGPEGPIQTTIGGAIKSVFGEGGVISQGVAGIKAILQPVFDAFATIGKAIDDAVTGIKEFLGLSEKASFTEGGAKSAGTKAVQTGTVPQFKAAGGAVSGNMPYIVGERGPELFVPGVSGSILTAADTRGALSPMAGSGVGLGGGGGNTLYIQISSPVDPESLFDRIQMEAARRNIKLGMA